MNPTTSFIRAYTDDFFGVEPDRLIPISGSGSNRVNMRATYPGRSFIVTFGEDIVENNTFMYLAQHFRSVGLPVPKVIDVHASGKCYIQEDFGSIDALSQLLTVDAKTQSSMLKTIIDWLVQFQTTGTMGIDYLRCHPAPRFDVTGILYDLHYFNVYFLSHLNKDVDTTILHKEFYTLALMTSTSCFNTFMYRDFQSRNIMVRDGQYHFIDFQGGRCGPGIYDVISLLYQAKLGLSQDTIHTLSHYYFEQIGQIKNIDPIVLANELELMRIVRLLQVLGAYGRRGLIEKKPHFLESINPILTKITALLHNPYDPIHRFPYLEQQLNLIIQNITTIECLINS